MKTSIVRTTVWLMAFAMLSCQAETSKNSLVDASAWGDCALVETLLKNGADPNASGVDDWTRLTIAAKNGQIDAVKTLLHGKAKIDAPEGGGNSALFWAALHGHFEVVKLLVEHGATIGPVTLGGKPPLKAAEEEKHADIAKLPQKQNGKQKLGIWGVGWSLGDRMVPAFFSLARAPIRVPEGSEGPSRAAGGGARALPSSSLGHDHRAPLSPPPKCYRARPGTARHEKSGNRK